MDQVWQELMSNWPDTPELIRMTFRLLVAAAAGAVPGIQREHVGTPAGLRTHILVSLGSALFVLTAMASSASPDAATRVLQGIATGIGFVGAGAIMKSGELKQIHGLTTAASIWMTAALGTAAGLGSTALALIGAILAFIVLSLLHRFEAHALGTSEPR